MSTKRVIIGGTQWGITDEQQENVASLIGSAMLNNTTVQLPLVDFDDNPVTVYFNGATGAIAVVDLNTGPKPTEITN